MKIDSFLPISIRIVLFLNERIFESVVSVQETMLREQRNRAVKSLGGKIILRRTVAAFNYEQLSVTFGKESKRGTLYDSIFSSSSESDSDSESESSASATFSLISYS